MRPNTFIPVALASALALIGCANPPPPAAAPPHAPPAPAPAGGDDEEPHALAQQVREQAERLQLLMAQGPAPKPQAVAEPDDAGAQVVWIDSPHPRINPQTLLAPAAIEPIEVQHEPVIEQSAAPPAQQTPAAAPPDRQQLIAALARQVRQSDDPVMVRALRLAALSALDSRQDMDLSGLSLNADQREQIYRYQQTLVQLAGGIAAGQQLDAPTLSARLYEIFGQGTIAIRHAALCRSVRSYGVYDEFESHSFLAGREQPIIVYAELDQFQSLRSDDQQYEVRLAQEVVLYNESDGLAVWRQPRVQIVDRSRNQRRDFFVVQLIRLPPLLNVGRYHLKVRITDLQGNSVDEISLPIQLVADHALVRQDK
jgi:hypothetical protein